MNMNMNMSMDMDTDVDVDMDMNQINCLSPSTAIVQLSRYERGKN